MDPDGWAARAERKTKRLRSREPAHRSLQDQNKALKEYLREAYAGKSPPPGMLKKLGVTPAIPEPRRMPAPSTAQGLLLKNSVLNTQDRIDRKTGSEDEGESMPLVLNPTDLFRPQNMSVATRMQRLEGLNALPLFDTPEALANSTIELIMEHPLLSADERCAQVSLVQRRAQTMRVFLASAKLDADETTRIMHKCQLDMMMNQTDDAMYKSFEKAASSTIDKKAKRKEKEKQAKESAEPSAEKLADLVSNLLKQFAGAKKANKHFAAKKTVTDESSDESDAKASKRKHKNKNRRKCFVCGERGHAAKDCPKKDKKEKD